MPDIRTASATPNAPAGPARPEGGDIFNDPVFLKYLKIAVVVMALILILGFIGIIARIFYVSSRVPAQPQPAAAGSSAAPASAQMGPLPALLERIRLELPRDAAVRSISLSGSRVAVHYDSPAGAGSASAPGIAIVDLETGRTLSRIDLMPAR